MSKVKLQYAGGVFFHGPIADTVNFPTDVFRFAHFLNSCGVNVRKLLCDYIQWQYFFWLPEINPEDDHI